MIDVKWFKTLLTDYLTSPEYAEVTETGPFGLSVALPTGEVFQISISQEAQLEPNRG